MEERTSRRTEGDAAGRTVKDFKRIIGEKDYRGRTVTEERKEDTRRGLISLKELEKDKARC